MRKRFQLMRFRHFYFPLLMVMALPAFFIITEYKWDFNHLGEFEWLNYITVTGDGIFAIISCFVILFLLFFFYRSKFSAFIAITFYSALIILGTQGIKVVMKNTIQEPRPYVYEMSTYLAQEMNDARSNITANPRNVDQFLRAMSVAYYKTKAGEPFEVFISEGLPHVKLKDNSGAPRANDERDLTRYQPDNAPASQDPATNFNNSPFVFCKNGNQACAPTEAQITPDDVADLYYSLTNEQQEFFTTFFANYNTSAFGDLGQRADARAALAKMANETAYSLPSGHGMLAAYWMFMIGVACFSAKQVKFGLFAGVVVFWGFTMQASRILLGYHYAHDVLASSLIVAVCTWFTWKILYAINKLCRTILRLNQPNPR